MVLGTSILEPAEEVAAAMRPLPCPLLLLTMAAAAAAVSNPNFIILFADGKPSVQSQRFAAKCYANAPKLLLLRPPAFHASPDCSTGRLWQPRLSPATDC